MRNAALPLLAALVASCCTADVHPGRTVLDTDKLPHVAWLADTDGGSGSGFTIANGWVLTAKHVPPLMDETLEVFEHPWLDLALVRIPGLHGSVTFSEPPPFGSRVYAMGWHHGTSMRLTEGLQGEAAGEMSAPVFPGASGGPVMNDRGEVFGVISRVLFSNYGQPEGETYIVSFCSWYAPVDTSWITYVLSNNP